MKRPPLSALLLLALACPALSSAPEPKADSHALFRDGDRVCLIGDSIAHSGTFHSHIFLYYATRFPERRVTFMNCGISGDSASGMQRRLHWDVFARRPSVVTLSAGMNDVGRSLYSPSKPVENAAEKQKEAIERFKENIRQLAASFQERGLRTIFITPTPYEEDPGLPTENLRGVNAALGQCSDFVLDFAKSQKAVAVDFWHPLNAISEKGKKADPAFTLTRKDRVHPEAAAHLLMAYLFLDQTGAPSDVWRLSIDATKLTVVSQNNCEASELECKEDCVTFSNRELALPWPFIEEAKAAYALAPITERLNQQVLQISGLATGRYDLAINDAVVGTYSHDEMQRGVNLAENAHTPQNRTGRELAALCAEHHSLGSKLRTLRRVEIKHLAKVDIGDRAAVKAALEKFIAEKEAAKKDPEANSGYYIKTARTYLEESGNEAAIKVRMAAIEDEIYRLNRPRSYAYSLVEQKEPTKQP